MKTKNGVGGHVSLWLRVSTDEQDLANQELEMRAWAKRRDWEIAHIYRSRESAYSGRPQALKSVFADASRGRLKTLLVWALDRLSRQGPLATLEIVHRLGRYGVTVVSYQEPWTEAAGELRDLLLAIAGWVAQQESQRRSERTKAGLARAKADGKTLGRPAGSRDRKKRRTSGYHARWAK